MVRIQIDLDELAARDTAQRPGFTDALLAALPGLQRHHCSTGRPGGFVERLHEGTRLGHVIEHVALELQVEAGMPASRGKTREVRGHDGVYNVMFAYQDEQVARLAGRVAIQLVDSLLAPADRGVAGLDLVAAPPSTDAAETIAGLAALRAMAARRTLGPTTRSLVEEARRRGIPVQRADDQSLIRLGQGVNQRSFRAGLTDSTSHLAVQTAASKQQTKTRLRAAAIPVPDGSVVTTVADAIAAAAALGGAVVTKPLDGNHGRGVSRGLRTPDGIARGFDIAAEHGPRVIVETRDRRSRPPHPGDRRPDGRRCRASPGSRDRRRTRRPSRS